MTLDWFGNKAVIDLVVEGEEDEDIDPLQYESYEEFKLKWNSIRANIICVAFSYYVNLRDELGYSDGSNKNYPEISSAEEIKNKITLDSIVVPLSRIYNRRSIALAFHCEWDTENGLGIILVNEQLYNIGYQDIAF